MSLLLAVGKRRLGLGQTSLRGAHFRSGKGMRALLLFELGGQSPNLVLGRPHFCLEPLALGLGRETPRLGLLVPSLMLSGSLPIILDYMHQRLRLVQML